MKVRKAEKGDTPYRPKGLRSIISKKRKFVQQKQKSFSILFQVQSFNLKSCLRLQSRVSQDFARKGQQTWDTFRQGIGKCLLLIALSFRFLGQVTVNGISGAFSTFWIQLVFPEAEPTYKLEYTYALTVIGTEGTIGALRSWGEATLSLHVG